MSKSIQEIIDERNAYSFLKYGKTIEEEKNVLEHIKETIDMASNEAYYMGLSDAYICHALYNIVHNPDDSPMEYLNKALRLIHTHHLDKRRLLNLYRAYVVYYIEIETDMEKALDYTASVMDIASELNDQELITRYKSNMAVINLQLQNYDVAEEYLNESISYYKSKNDSYHLMYDYNNLGELYLNMDEIEKSKELYKKAYTLALENQDTHIRQDVATGLSRIYRQSGEFEKSKELLDENIHFVMPSNNSRYLVELVIEKIHLLIDMDRLQEAKELMLSINNRTETLKNNRTLDNYYAIKVDLHERLKEYQEAFFSQKKRDDIRSEMNLESSRKSENARVRNQYKRTIERLETIADIGRNVASLDDIDELLTEVRGTLEKLMSVDNIGIGEIQNDGLHFTHYFVGDVKTDLLILNLKNPTSLATWCIKNNKEVNIGNLSKESNLYVKNVLRVPVKDTDQKNRVTSVMYTPLRVRGEIIGVFTLQSYKENAYRTEEFEIFKILSSYVSIAYKNILQSRDLEALSVMDSLTKIKNRKGFIDAFDGFRDKTEDKPLALLMLDLDFFKRINDTYGHIAGDKVLKEVGKILNDLENQNTKVGRLGGEEFGVILYDVDHGKAYSIASEILVAISEAEIIVDDDILNVTTSIGLTYSENLEKSTYRELYRQADKALYDAKDSGRNCIIEYVPS